MKALLLVATAATLSGCSGFTNCDTAGGSCDVEDTNTNTNTGTGTPVLQNVDGSCSGSTCTWEVVASGGGIGTVGLDLIETGDDSYDCSQPDEGQLICGVWTEYHSDFVLSDFDDTSETKRINLSLVGSYVDQVNNTSTIFDVSDSAISNQLTVLFIIEDENGDYADCATYGHNPSVYSDYCTNVW